ncbi:MAG: glycosyltransferase family 1 protein [Deltaproteobacteria bacterium]|nr:glycosyltransferase family 1 protein [Deltaproteobacteria bacterium]
MSELSASASAQPPRRDGGVLLMSIGMQGCVNPLVELASVLRARGHRVRLATDESLLGRIRSLEGEGVELLSSGRRADYAALLERLLHEASQSERLAFSHLLWHERWLRTEARHMHQHLEAALRADPPRLIVGDIATYAAKRLARGFRVPLLLNHAGVPPSLFENLLWPQGLVMRLVSALVRAHQQWKARSLSPSALRKWEWQARLGLWPHYDFKKTPLLCNTMLGAEREEEIPAGLQLTGAMGGARPGQRLSDAANPGLREWLDDARSTGSKVIYASFGSVMVPSNDLLARVTEGLRRLVDEHEQVRVLWSLGANYHPAALPLLEGVDRRRLRIETWVPQVAVLEHGVVEAMLYHGGANGVHEALSRGIPLVIVPFGFDQVGHGRMVAAEGAGLWMGRHEVSAASLSRALHTILTDPGFARAAQLLRDRDRRLGGAARVAQLIEERL